MVKRLLLLTLVATLVSQALASQVPFMADASPKYPKTGLALQITEPYQTKPQTLARVDIPQELKEQEVLIKVIAAAQNPVDSKYIDLGRLKSFPTTVGGDVAGDVLAVGSDVKHLKVGDRVAAFLSRSDPRHAGYQQYTIGSAPQTFRFPKHVTYEEASTIPLAFSTAVGGIFSDLKIPIPPSGSKLPLPANDQPAVLVWGGSSSVGAFAIQLAKLSGYSVVTTASHSNFDYVKSLGADVVVDYHDAEKAVKAIRDATKGRLSLALDAISENGSTELVAKSFGPDGGVINVVLPVDDSVLNGRKDIKIKSAGARSVYEDPKLLDSFRFLVEALEQKKFQPNRVEIIPDGLLGVDKGFARQRAHAISGVKLVYQVLETPGIKE